MSRITVIEAPHYEETRKALAADPIIQAMAEELRQAPPEVRATFAHDDGTPRHDFMLAANREYRSRGGPSTPPTRRRSLSATSRQSA